MTIWASADTHWHHGAILAYCGRPFADRYVMTEALISAWNERVADGDTAYMLGDLTFTTERITAELVARLKGRIEFVMGNHDGSYAKNMRLGFAEVHRHPVTIEAGGVRLRLSHEPLYDPEEWDGCRVLLHGHVHKRWRERFLGEGAMVNVGVDVWDFKPVSLDEVLALPSVRSALGLARPLVPYRDGRSSDPANPVS